MGAPRNRTPNQTAARAIACAFYDDFEQLEWIPSDDADIFRLTFASDRAPRILKLETHGIKALRRELTAFPAMRALGVPELLEFEHTSEELPEIGFDFHITPEFENPQAANQQLAATWVVDCPAALDLAEWLGDCARRIESLDWRAVPGANPPERSEAGWAWWGPHYRVLLAHQDAPPWLASLVNEIAEAYRRPEAFGGWFGEMLRRSDGTFVLIDWPGLGAAPFGSLAAVVFEKLLVFGAEDPGQLVSRFLTGWAPGGLDLVRLEALRTWLLHNMVGWVGMQINLGDPDADAEAAFQGARRVLALDDPGAWIALPAAIA